MLSRMRTVDYTCLHFGMRGAPSGVSGVPLVSEDLSNVDKAWPCREFFQFHREATPPIRMLVRSGRNIYRIGFVRKIVDLHHCKSGRCAREEGMRGPR